MSYFLCERDLEPGLSFRYGDEDAHHLLKSRRMREGERFQLQDPRGLRFEVELLGKERRAALVRVLAALETPPPPRLRLTLLQAAVKDKAAELIVQKATELGVASVVFFVAEHSPLTTKALSLPATLTRWERIALEACKQCGRVAPPQISALSTLDAALALADSSAGGWLLHPGPESLPPWQAVEALRKSGQRELALWVGPEGGFSNEELERLRTGDNDGGCTPVSLGANVLRADTAALAGAALALLGGEGE